MNDPDLIIIGAARSGTNALRDALCSTRGFHTWPCDEINYIWRSGNRDAPTDALTRADARPDVVRRIRTSIARRRASQQTLVEKTCANSLRVGFVDEIDPSARFVHIIRDGRDVVASARERWRAPLDVRYLARKARFVPVRDVPYYGLRYISHRVARLCSSARRLPTWGPRFPGIDELVEAGASLEEVCAHQWVECVSTAHRQLGELTPSRVLEIRYEDLVAAPHSVLDAISTFAGVTSPRAELVVGAEVIHGGRVGSWKSALDEREHSSSLSIVAPLLDDLGYR